MHSRELIFGILVFFFILSFGCVVEKKSPEPSGLSVLTDSEDTSPTICVTEVKDRATGELLFKETTYSLGLSNRRRIDYINEKVAGDEFFRRMILLSVGEEGYELINHYIENETHEGYVVYSTLPDYVKEYRKIVGDELYEKYFGECKMIMSSNFVTREEAKKYSEELEEHLRNYSDDVQSEKIYKEVKEDEEKFAQKYEEKTTCSPGQFGEEIFVITEGVCSYEEIDKKLEEMYNEYSQIQIEE